MPAPIAAAPNSHHGWPVIRNASPAPRTSRGSPISATVVTARGNTYQAQRHPVVAVQRQLAMTNSVSVRHLHC